MASGKHHHRDAESTDLAERLLMAGCTCDMAAKVMDMSEKSFRTHYKDVTEKTMAMKNAEIAGVAYRLAKSGENDRMTIFWLKTRAGWKETSALEHSGGIGIRWEEPDDGGHSASEASHGAETDSGE